MNQSLHRVFLGMTLLVVHFAQDKAICSDIEPTLGGEQMVDSISQLRALALPSSTDKKTLKVRWYDDPRDGGGGTFIWSASSTAPDDGGLVISPAKGGTNGRWLRLLAEPGVISPLYFGARCNGISDDGAPINRALARLRTPVGRGDMERYAGILRLPARQCTVMTTINSTGLSAASVMIEGTGGSLLCETNGAPCIDAMDSARLSFRDLTLYGDEVKMPSVGLQLGRPSTNASAAGMYLDHVSISGYFSFAAFYNLNAETQLDVKLNASNAAKGGFGAVYDGINHWKAQSQFVAITSPVEKMQSFNDNTCLNCRITSSGVGGIPVWVAGTAELTFENSYISNFNNGPGAVLYGLNTNPHFDAHFEAAGLTSVFVLAGAKHVTLYGLHYWEHDFFGSVSMFALEKGTETASLQNADINVGRFHFPKRGAWFDNPAHYTISGRVSGTTSLGWQIPGGGFSGTACFADLCSTHP